MRILEVGRRAGLSKVGYGREGRQLVASGHAQLVVWSLETFEQERVVPRAAPVTPLDCLFLPGGRAFLEANGYWKAVDELPAAANLSEDHLRHAGHLTPLTGFRCFAADGKSVLRETYSQSWQSPQRLALWDFAGTFVRGYPRAGLLGKDAAAFSPDGKILALDGAGVTIALFDSVTREQVAQLTHTHRVFGLTFSPDGKRLAASAGRTVRIWSVPGGECLHKFRAFRGYSKCRAFSPDGTLLVAGSSEGRVRTWDVESGRELSDHAWRQGAVSDVAFAPDGQTAAAACGEAVVVWDVDI